MSNPENVGLASQRLARIVPVIAKYIDDDKIAGAVTLVARRGQVVALDCVGVMDRASRKPMRPDTIFRIHSMTKPITCVALMMLYEQGCFQLFDPVSKFIPAFDDLKVFEGGKLIDLVRPVTIQDLLTHTSGLTYHFLEYGPVEAMYRDAQVITPKPLSEFVANLLELPLALQPGTAWRYSFGHDVAGLLIEIMSGQALDVFLQERLFDPLGMVDTGYFVPQDKWGRFATMYGSAAIEHSGTTLSSQFGGAVTGINRRLAGPEDSLQSRPHNALRGGSGLVSTVSDYARFCQMLLNNGVLDGTRYLGRKTLELMVANHLKPKLMPYEIGGFYSPGYGYGLGFRVLMDVGQCMVPGTVGEYGWGGAASTHFWIDPKEAFIGIQMAQYQPSGYYPIASDFRVAAYQAIID